MKKNKLKGWQNFVLFNLVFATGLHFMFCPSCWRRMSLGEIFSQLLSYYLLSFVLSYGNYLIANYLNKKISWEKESRKRFIVGSVVALVFSLAVFSAWWYYYVIVSTDRVMEDHWGSLYSSLVMATFITAAVSLGFHSWGFFQNWRIATLRVEKLQKEQAQSRFHSLRQQLNPHFLFNSLNVLSDLVYSDQDQAARFIKKLSEIYRYVLDSSQKEIISLDQELDFIQSYLFLLEIRFGENLKSEIDVPENSQYLIAPLSLQLLVENAIKHNIISNKKNLNISIFIKNEYLIIKNNLQVKSKVHASDGSGYGLDNIRERYALLSEKAVIVEDGGDDFVVKLPLLEMEN